MSNSKLKDIKDLVLCLNLNNTRKRYKKNLRYSLIVYYELNEKMKIMYPVYSLYSWSKKKCFDDSTGKNKFVHERFVHFEKINQLDCLIELSRMVQELNG